MNPILTPSRKRKGDENTPSTRSTRSKANKDDPVDVNMQLIIPNVCFFLRPVENLIYIKVSGKKANVN